MGVLHKMTKKVALKAKDAACSTANHTKEKVFRSAEPTEAQISALESKRDDFLKNLPGQNEEKFEKEISCHLAGIETEIFQSYLNEIKNFYEPVKADTSNSLWKPAIHENQAWNFDITKWVTDPSEDSIEKLCNVYQVLSGEPCSVALIYHRTKNGCQVQLATCNNKEHAETPETGRSIAMRLQKALVGNFPGVKCSKPMQFEREFNNVVVAVVSNLATEKSEHFISQSIEKLLDGVVPQDDNETYTIILLATPVLDQNDRRKLLYQQYTAISPFAQVQKQIGLSDSATIMSNTNVGGNLGIYSGVAVGVQIGYSAGTTLQAGTSESRTLTYTNYEVKHCMERIEQQMKRIEQCQSMGMWDFAAYVISEDYNTAQNVAHMYTSLTQGEQSFLEPSAINVWKGTDSANQSNEQKVANYICQSLRLLQHPPFFLKQDNDDNTLFYPALVNPTTMVSGNELAHALNFPRKSVNGLPVYECVPFGREVVLHTENETETEKKTDKPKNNDTIPLGNIYHMRAEEKNTPVSLQKNSLTAHTFITGSTGAGKSNTVYKMLHELCLKGDPNMHFLVIEPAKGEYKSVVGGYPDVHVYGTNPQKTELLQLNPFSFPDDTHVLEHIDRLVEVFNACWPMYAAMPAVLKAAVERAYTDCGWSLQSSTCIGSEKVFPTFRDVMKALPDVINSKGFSNDTQGDYRGALLTRLESLTNGINGQVLCSAREIDTNDLFNKNVIVDLSRVGSSETKALLMGILILKLQEYRMAERAEKDNKDSNKGLHHITVLEEAHNLLRRTSSEQSQESSNLQGKSVEMLTNAIAEMRTYGEGFIIADQAPGLLDMAVIRNTNTKIILRLPDESDRILVGKAAGLNDDQIVELSRLDTGVAAVYQNHWLEPVLCKVSRFEKEEMSYHYEPPKQDNYPNSEFFKQLLSKGEWEPLKDEQVDRIRYWVNQLDTGIDAKRILLDAVNHQERPSEEDIRFALYSVVKGQRLINASINQTDDAARKDYINRQIQEVLHISEEITDLVRQQIYYYIQPLPERENLELRKVLM